MGTDKRDDARQQFLPCLRMILCELEQLVHHFVEVLKPVGYLLEELPLRWKGIKLNILELDQQHFIESRELCVATGGLVYHLAIGKKLNGVELCWCDGGT